ncbi:hypothetical protein ACOYR1_17720 [Thalassotalea piscium]
MDIDGLQPEAQARITIDEKLKLTGWKVQTWPNTNLGEGVGVAIREYPVDSGKGKYTDSADYLLFIDRKAVGVIEAKKDETIFLKSKSRHFATQRVKLNLEMNQSHFLSYSKQLAKLFTIAT